MEIILKEKRVLQAGDEFSSCLVLYSADGVSMFQYADLNNELPEAILLQVCGNWAKKHFAGK